MSDELGPLPEPLNLSPLPRLIVLGHTPAQMRAYAAQEVARERERIKARAVQIVEWHRNDYNRQQIDPIVAALRNGI